MEIESIQQILERRKEIEQELMDMLQETESDFTMSPHQNFWCGDVDHVRDAIYNEEDNDDMIYPIGYKVIQRGEVVAMFDPVRYEVI